MGFADSALAALTGPRPNRAPHIEPVAIDPGAGYMATVLLLSSASTGGHDRQRMETLGHLGLPDSIRAAAEAVMRPCLALSVHVDQEPLSAWASYVAGHPYVPVGEDWTWPIGKASQKPMTFVGQVCFDELPYLSGFPRAGVLQWYCDGLDPDYTLGLRWGKEATGREGLLVRYYPVREDAQYSPSHPGPHAVPPPPLLTPGPHAITGNETWVLPGWETVQASRDPLMAAYASIADTLVPFDAVLPTPRGFTLGGYPLLIQGDPRDEGRPDGLVLGFDSLDSVLCWGDVGTAQIYGDVTALFTGDTSSFWWDWACS